LKIKTKNNNQVKMKPIALRFVLMAEKQNKVKVCVLLWTVAVHMTVAII